ncbi:hypothetical protein AB3N60_11130 [Leptospira sp. WS39.C2]
MYSKFTILSAILLNFNCATFVTVGNAGVKPYKNQQYLNELNSINTTNNSLVIRVHTTERLETDELKNYENDSSEASIGRLRCINLDISKLKKENIIQIPTNECKNDTDFIDSLIRLGSKDSSHVPAIIFINENIRIESGFGIQDYKYNSHAFSFYDDQQFEINNFPNKEIKSVIGYSGHVIIIFTDDSAYSLKTGEYKPDKLKYPFHDSIITSYELNNFLDNEICYKPNHCIKYSKLYINQNLLPVDENYGRMELSLDTSNNRFKDMNTVYRFTYNRNQFSDQKLIKITITNRIDYKSTLRPILYLFTPIAIAIDIITLPLQAIGVVFVALTYGVSH